MAEKPVEKTVDKTDKAKDDKKKSKEEVHKKIETILAQNGGREADIPPSHEYWDLVNQYRSMK